jgi:hypothetical protein
MATRRSFLPKAARVGTYSDTAQRLNRAGCRVLARAYPLVPDDEIGASGGVFRLTVEASEDGSNWREVAVTIGDLREIGSVIDLAGYTHVRQRVEIVGTVTCEVSSEA